MDGETAIERALGSSRDWQRPRSVAADTGEQAATLRARLVAAIVETLAQGSHPRLDRTAYARAGA
jgi:hypothetical protein